MPALMVKTGVRETELPLKAGVHVLGRAAECDLCIPHGSISRRHAELTVAVSPRGNHAECRVRDLGSSNGTLVQGEPVEVGVVSDGQIFQCGDLEFTFRAVGSHERPSLIIHVDEERSQTLNYRHSIGVRDTHTPAGFEEEVREQRRLLLQAHELLFARGPEGEDAVLTELADLIVDVFRADRVVALLRSPVDGALEPKVARGPGKVAVDMDEAYSARIVEYVRDRSVGALFANVRDDVRLIESQSIPERGIRSAMAVPIATQRETLGVLYLDARRPGEVFGRIGLDVLNALASQAALTIENTRLQGRLREEAIRRSQLARFFPPSVVNRLLDTEQGSLTTQERAVSLLFCDISGFSALCESYTPTEVARLLNAYLPRMVAIAHTHGGTVEKYVGDAMLICFGAPYSTGRDAAMAIDAAVAMQNEAKAFAQSGDAPHDFAIHIGIASGVAAAGSIGAADYVQYATVGAVTNVAARICDLAGRGEVLCDEATLNAAQRGDRMSVAFEPLPEHSLKGMRLSPRLFRLHYG